MFRHTRRRPTAFKCGVPSRRPILLANYHLSRALLGKGRCESTLAEFALCNRVLAAQAGPVYDPGNRFHALVRRHDVNAGNAGHHLQALRQLDADVPSLGLGFRRIAA